MRLGIGGLALGISAAEGSPASERDPTARCVYHARCPGLPHHRVRGIRLAPVSILKPPSRSMGRVRCRYGIMKFRLRDDCPVGRVP